MARPRKELDQDQFESLCRMNPTLKDVSAFFKLSEDTIHRRCLEWGYTGFADARQQSMVHTRLNLIRRALKQAESGNTTMLIFCLKNLCGWADKQETIQTGEIKINIDKEDVGL